MSAAESEWTDEREREEYDARRTDHWYQPELLARKLPQDVGLSPLGCGDCGADEIVDHPCPECGWNPQLDKEQQSLEVFARE